MNMKEHILDALREQIERWEAQLANMGDAQIAAPLLPSSWTVKDVLTHLRTWQLRSIARIEAGLRDRLPEFPQWVPGLDPDDEAVTEPVNDWIYRSNRQQPWAEVHQSWRAGYLRLLELAQGLSERDLLDPSRYPWMGGSPLAFVLLGTYDHHQEHLDMLQAWLQDHGSKP
jgi:hypothetical protein